MPNIAPLAASVPFALSAADAATDFNVVGTLGQLGMAGVVITFAVWLQDKFTKQRKEAEAVLREERDKAILAEKAAKDELISLLKEKLAKAEGS